MLGMGVEHRMDDGPYQGTDANLTPNTVPVTRGVRLWGISFIVERETAQTAS